MSIIIIKAKRKNISLTETRIGIIELYSRINGIGWNRSAFAKKNAETKAMDDTTTLKLKKMTKPV
jgi:hypothetical protein